MKKFDTLYKRAANGAIRKWMVSVYEEPFGQFNVQRLAGQVNGTFTPAIDYDVQGKNIGRANETTPEYQAEFNAQSYWNKKKDEGYKTLSEIGVSTEAELWSALPEYNTDAQGNIKPMLAKTVNWAKVEFPVLVQPKLDGVRCLMVVKDDEIYFQSRSGKMYTTLGHIESELLEHIRGENFILDGEVYSHEISFQEIISAVKAKGINSSKLHFRAYDTVDSMPQSARIQTLSSYLRKMNFKTVHFVETHLVHDKERVMELHSKWTEDGYEGAMIRFLDGKYKQGVRSSELLKVKEFNEEEFDCYELTTGKREEDVIALCRTAEGKEFKAKMMGTREEKEELMDAFEPAKLTVKFFGWTNDNIPRFPIGKSFRNYE